MGYLKKGNIVCNPAKKNLTVFQNSYQKQTGTGYSEQASFTITAIYGGVRMSVTSNMPSGAVVYVYNMTNGITYPVSISNGASLPGGGQLFGLSGWQRIPAGWTSTGNQSLGRTSSAYPIYSTAWNTKWKKLNA